jgi:Ca-activated chloride channel family protein
MLVDTLTPKDTVAVVTYAGSAGLKLQATRGDQKVRIRAVVDGLAAGGSTNGAGGIALAYEQARANFIEGGCNRVILCTDGDFNVGVSSEGELVRLIEKQREGNVFLTVLGYGMGNLKDGNLEALARHGNGHYAYIDSEAEARRVFVEQGGALTAVAKDVKLQVEFNPAAVSAYRLIGYENRLLNAEDFKDDAKDAGDLGSGHTVTALYEVVPVGTPIAMPEADKLKYQWSGAATAAAKTGEWLTAKMRYKHPEANDSREVVAVLTAEAAAKPADGDFRFAAAVAEFALLLRDSKDKGSASLDRVLAAASETAGADPHGHRAGFVELVKQARRVVGVKTEAAAR